MKAQAPESLQPHWGRWMDRALDLAALAQGRTSPNPLVGALVLDASGLLVGEGFHAAAGRPHAEVGALAQAGDRAQGGTLVVTLEPCCHHGRTPPCSEAVIAARIRRVIVAMEDPDPRVAGQGIAQIRAAGLEVILGVGEAQARSLNTAFCHRVRTGWPLGILKWAMSVDGRTSLPNGDSQWISSPLARDWVHRLRARCDAVIVGGGTMRMDDPLLTSRGRRTPEPLRVVLSRQLDLPAQARLWDLNAAPTLVAHGPDAPEEKRHQLEDLGIERLELPACEPAELMRALAVRGCNQVLWECGAELAAAAMRQGCVQRVAAVVAPKVLGGTAARTPVGDLQLTSMAMAPLWRERQLSRSGADLIWDLCVPDPMSGSDPAP